jgi:hypothetical protein
MCLNFTGALLEKEVAPGEEISHTITISLSGNESSMEATGGIYGYGMGLDGTRIPREDDEEMKPFSAIGFLKLTPENATIEPGKPAVFVIEGRVPEDIGSGGKYALVEIHTPPQNRSQIGIALAVIAPIRLTITGTDLVETGEITDLDVSGDGASAIFKNNGNHHFKASSEAILKNDKSEVVASAKAPLMNTALVPAASWLFKMNFKLENELNHGDYTIEVKVIREDGTVLDSKEKTFTI